MITAGEKLRLKIERPFVVLFYHIFARWFGGNKFLLLTTTGRNSQQSRTVPLVYMPVTDGFLVVAANLGSDSQPGWYLNLKHNPQAQIQIGTTKLPVRGEESTTEMREPLWANWIQQNPGYQGFQAKTARKLPLVILKSARPS